MSEDDWKKVGVTILILALFLSAVVALTNHSD